MPWVIGSAACETSDAPVVTQVMPVVVAMTATGGPTFSTTVLLSASGLECRNRGWRQPVRQWQIDLAGRTRDEIAGFCDFFLACNGRQSAFPFQDWTDFSATGQLLGVGDGSRNVWQLTKSYAIGAIIPLRTIIRPNISTVVVYFDGVAQTSGYWVDPNSGQVSFVRSPLVGTQITVDFQFFVLARFGSDVIDLAASTSAFWTSSGITLVEVREPTLPLSGGTWIAQGAIGSSGAAEVVTRGSIHGHAETTSRGVIRGSGSAILVDEDIVFPNNIPYGSTTGPQHSTIIAANQAGWERRFKDWQFPRRRWTVGSSQRRAASLYAIVALFMASGGRHHAFRLLDFLNNTVTNQVIGTGDGIICTFQLGQSVVVGRTTVWRPILRPIPTTVQITIDGVPDTAWRLDDAGVVILVFPPRLGAVIRASFGFHCLARFDTDSMSLQATGPVTLTWTSIPLIEVQG